MASRSLFFLAALVLLVGLAAASGAHGPYPRRSPTPSPESLTPMQHRARRRCRFLLKKARKELKCALLRISLPRRLSKARKCRYAGMSFSDYKRVRTMCKERSESLTRLRAARKKCRMAGISVRFDDDKYHMHDKEEEKEEDEEVDVSGITCAMHDELLAARRKAVRACTMIGWTGGRARSQKCEKLRPLKYMLHHLKKSKCGEDGVEEAQKDLKKIKSRCKGTGGIVEPPPSNAPRKPRSA